MLKKEFLEKVDDFARHVEYVCCVKGVLYDEEQDDHYAVVTFEAFGGLEYSVNIMVKPDNPEEICINVYEDNYIEADAEGAYACFWNDANQLLMEARDRLAEIERKK